MNEIPRGMLEAPPYAERRLMLSSGGRSYDVAPIQSLDCWNHAFQDGIVDWETGWRKLWSSSADMIGTGTDFSIDRVGIEIEAYFDTGEFASIGTAVLCDSEEEETWEPKALNALASVCRLDNPVAGCVGIVVDRHEHCSRPCLTVMVSGPGGALESAKIVRQALADYGLNAGVAFRAVRQGTAGVVKIPFLPELYLLAGHNSFGIDWNLWSKLAPQSPAAEWASATLLWCDSVIAAVEKLRKSAPLMIDGTYFDFMRLVPLSAKILAQDLILGEQSLADLMRCDPHEFMF